MLSPTQNGKCAGHQVIPEATEFTLEREKTHIKQVFLFNCLARKTVDERRITDGWKLHMLNV